MGSAYKKNMKNLLGNQDVTGHDVLHLGEGSAATAQAAAPLEDGNGVDVFIMPRRARLEGVIVNTQGTTLTSGNLGFELWAAGAVVASGNINAGTPSYLQILLDKENDNEVLLAAGDSVFLNLGIDATLSSNQDISARIHLAMLE